MHRNGKRDGGTISTPPPPRLDPGTVTGQDEPREIIKTRATSSDDEKARLEAVSRLKGDFESLKSVVMNSKYRDTRVAAAELVLESKEAVIELLVCENRLAISAMIETLHRRPEIMMDIAKSSMNSNARAAVIEKLREKSHLVEVASVSIYTDSREAALSKLTDMPDAMEEVAIVSSYSDTRAKALSLLASNAGSLERIASKCLFEDTRGLANEHLAKIRQQS